jgi:hypothetical protein
MIINIFTLQESRIMSCDFIIITHYLPNTNYVFENDLVFKKDNGTIKPISTYMSGRCKVAKINKTPKSLKWLKANRKPKIDIFARNIQLLPF